MLWATCSSRVKRCATSARCNCVAEAHSKKGTSLATSTAMSPRPHGSCVVSHGGGASKPVAQGERARSSQPLGAIKNASPIANAACGTASMGPSARTQRAHAAEGNPRDSNHAAVATDSTLDIKPVHNVISSARGACESAVRFCQACTSSALSTAPHVAQTSGTPSVATNPADTSRSGVMDFTAPRCRPGRLPRRQTGRPAPWTRQGRRVAMRPSMAVARKTRR